MKQSRAIWLIAAALSLAGAPRQALAQTPDEPDEEGCKDSPVLSRLAGCRIMKCETRDFDSVEVQTGAPDPNGEVNKKSLEGQLGKIMYLCPARLSLLQIARNAENALRAAGFTIVFSGKNLDGSSAVTAQKGAQWVEVQTENYNEFTAYQQTTLKVQGMAQEMTATAEGLAAEIGKSGRVAVYGINFDTGKATIRPDSDAVLGEVAKLMKSNPAWKIKVEGHTDNVGAKEANKKLSEDRAEAVEKWLVAHGVDKARLSHEGFGDTRPAADNSTEQGRAKNRRVELAKIG
jgi:outer membrane protein OmpA-like peptidoglycan-associated protein